MKQESAAYKVGDRSRCGICGAEIECIGIGPQWRRTLYQDHKVQPIPITHEKAFLQWTLLKNRNWFTT